MRIKKAISVLPPGMAFPCPDRMSGYRSTSGSGWHGRVREWTRASVRVGCPLVRRNALAAMWAGRTDRSHVDAVG
jgi:hypothetical protein